MTKRIATTALLILTAFLAGLAYPWPAHATTTTIRTITINECAVSCGAGEVVNRANASANAIRTSGARVVNLQETCQANAIRLRDVLGSGWQLRFVKTTTAAKCSDGLKVLRQARNSYGNAYGIAILVKGTVRASWSQQLPHPGQREPRAVQGVAATVGAARFTAINTHASIPNTAANVADLTVVAKRIRSTAGPVIFACDCNAAKGSPGMAQIETALPVTYVQRIDHIASRGGTTSPTLYQVNSDHAAYAATVRL